MQFNDRNNLWNGILIRMDCCMPMVSVAHLLCRTGAISGQVTHLLNKSSLSPTEHSVSATFDDGQPWTAKV